MTKENQDNHEKPAAEMPPDAVPKFCPLAGANCLHNRCALWVGARVETDSPLAPGVTRAAALEGCVFKVGIFLDQNIYNALAAVLAGGRR